MLDLAILGLLEERDLHGYEIRRQLRDHLACWPTSRSAPSIPALTRLEKSRRRRGDRGRRPSPSRCPSDRLAQRRAGRPARPPRIRPHRARRGREGLPDHRAGPGQLFVELLRRSAARSTTRGASGFAWPSPATSPRRPDWPSWSAAGPNWSSAWPRPTRPAPSLDVYAQQRRPAHRRRRGQRHQLARRAHRV